YVLVEVNRNGFLSRVARTAQDRFSPTDSGFLTAAGKYLLPLAAILFAHVFGQFRVVLDPLMGFIR
ncbi:MAG TPA: hypothetical protein VH092_29040, partial [Urbifossiella sp.]|nr:hypothetical protein [Urbifossiella sp.]